MQANAALISEPATTLSRVDGLLRQGQWRKALFLLEPIRAYFPRSPSVLVSLAKCNCMRQEYTCARDQLLDALVLDPKHVNGLAILGVVYQLLGDNDSAAEALERAVALDPLGTEAMSNLGHVYTLGARTQEAITLLERAVSLAPGEAVIRNNLGRALVEDGRFEEALPHLDHALSLSPDYNSARYNRGIARLGSGQLRGGWEDWEYRFQANCSAHRSPVYSVFPLWRGENLLGKRILVYAEQGLGDELLFASCIPDLARVAKQVILQCNPRLEKLFARSFPGVMVHAGPRNETIDWVVEAGGVDFQTPAGEVAHYLRQDLADFPDTNAYLKPDPIRVAYWRDRLAYDAPGVKAGIAWRSRLLDPLRRRRYARLEDWVALFRLQGLSTVCLQYDDCTQELADLAANHGIHLRRFPEVDLFNDLDESVALMSALDVVVSVITSTFRFAAGAGVSTWLLGPPMRNWVNLGTNGLPWYPSVEMFRQSELGRWDDVVTNVVKRMEAQIRSHAI